MISRWIILLLLSVLRRFEPFSKMVVVESPFAGDVDRNLKYARAAISDCIKRGEIPYASHLFYTQEGILDDTLQHERDLGIKMGFAWAILAPKRVYYSDYGQSGGMVLSIGESQKYNQKREIRYINEN
jgi:hypothetical protein